MYVFAWRTKIWIEPDGVAEDSSDLFVFAARCLLFTGTYRVYYHEYDDSVPGQPVHLIKDVRSFFTSHAPPAVFFFFLFSNSFVA